MSIARTIVGTATSRRGRSPFAGVFVVVALGVLVLVATAASPTDETAQDKRLTESLSSFLTLWLEKKQPDTAVQSFFSKRIVDEAFVPAEWYPPRDYDEKFPPTYKGQPMELSNHKIAARMAEQLRRMAKGSGSWPPWPKMLAPFDAQIRGDVESAIKELKLTPSWIMTDRVLSIPVADWDSISWTASATAGHRCLLADGIKKYNVEMRGLLLRIAPMSSADPAMYLMLWADESPKRTGKWKFWGIIPVRED